MVWRLIAGDLVRRIGGVRERPGLLEPTNRRAGSGGGGPRGLRELNPFRGGLRPRGGGDRPLGAGDLELL